MSQNSGKQLNNWPLLAGLALLLYDYLLTLPSEIHIVWPRPKPWFILVRYLALSTNFTMVVLTFGTFQSQQFSLCLLSLGGLGTLAIGAWLGSTADTAVSLPGNLCILSHVSETLHSGARFTVGRGSLETHESKRTVVGYVTNSTR
ncbi:hypothetical protein B0H14DRAFT_3648948 [Mycena olivaceomarginata]|nr:hypothetical protein B0H14DRAFT_3648948 [Mycena olivaceomarginata]